MAIGIMATLYMGGLIAASQSFRFGWGTELSTVLVVMRQQVQRRCLAKQPHHSTIAGVASFE
jgi:hypothetical protein